MNNPFFSIIVTVYNKEEYLSRCIESIIYQSYTNIEIILINDGSTDDSGVIIDEYAIEDKRIIVKHKNNEGLTKARKDGIEISRGEYVIFVDADDWIQQNACEIFENAVKKSNSDIVVGGISKIFGKHQQIVKEAIHSGIYGENEIENVIIPQMIFTGNFFEKGLSSYICGKAIRKSLVEEIENFIDDNVRFGEGCAWLYIAMLRCRTLCILDDVLYNYAMNDDSMAISLTSIEEIFVLYKCLVNGIYQIKGEHKSLLLQNDYLAFYHLIWKKPDVFNYDEAVFFPFYELGKNDRIVIYGAWRYGLSLYKYLKERNFGNVIMLIDKNDGYNESIQREVYTPDSLVGLNYDYIILGSVIYSVIQSMLKTLNEIGIKENVLYLSTERVDLEKMPLEFKRYKCKMKMENDYKYG